jgi:hypoxanthine phosphoribosyltransferase
MNYIPEQVTFRDRTFSLLISPEEIKQKVEEIAEMLNMDYTDKKPLFLVILKGAVFFASDLLRKFNYPCDIEFIKIKSYGSEMQSSGKVDISDYKNIYNNRDVVIIEDIVDAGYTLSKLIEIINRDSPSSIEIVTFLSKPTNRKIQVNVKYIGFEIPGLFVVGYGMDWDEQGRNLPAIYSIKE